MKKILILLTLAILLISCTKIQANQNTSIKNTNDQQTKQSYQMPNPASVYCEEKGGTFEIITAEDGSQSAICTLKGDIKCDEWAYFRGECP